MFQKIELHLNSQVAKVKMFQKIEIKFKFVGGRTFRSQSDRVQRLLPERHEDEDFNLSQRNVQYLRPKQIQVTTRKPNLT